MAAVSGCSGRHVWIFLLGWVAYGSTYLLRKPLGVVKSDMQSELSFTSSQLGWMDTALILPYALFQMLLGSIGDRLGAGFTFGMCLILDCVVMFSFGWWSNYHVMLVLLFLNGTCQSICWPNATKVLSSWFTSGNRSSIFGMFGTSAFVGGVGGTALVVLLQSFYGWRHVFLLPAFIVGALGGLVVLMYHEAPNTPPIRCDTTGDTDTSPLVDKATANPQLPSWFSLWSISLVPEVSVAAFCIKLVRYAFYGWLPLYLFQHLNYSKAQAGMFSTMFDIGGVAGSALIGLFIDKLFAGRALLGSMVAIFISTVALALFAVTASWGLTINSVLLFIAGAFNCGPDTILVSMVTADLGNRDGRNAAAAVTGLVNGFGSLGSVFQGPLIGFILSVSGWPSVLIFMIMMSAFGTVAALRAALLDKPPKTGLQVKPPIV